MTSSTTQSLVIQLQEFIRVGSVRTTLDGQTILPDLT